MSKQSQDLREHLASPVTWADKIKGGAIALVLLALGVSMMIWPSLTREFSEASREATSMRARGIGAILALIWNPAVGAIAVLLGGLLAIAAIRKPLGEPGRRPPSDAGTLAVTRDLAAEQARAAAEQDKKEFARGVRRRVRRSRLTYAFFAWGAFMAFMSGWMLLDPTLMDSEWARREAERGARGSSLVRVLGPIWSREAGAIGLATGGVLLFSAYRRVRRPAPVDRNDSTTPKPL